MEISARIRSNPPACDVAVQTGGVEQRLTVAAKASGQGSAVNGGELLMAALATCYCNDLYREAARLGIAIRGCEVVASARSTTSGARRSRSSMRRASSRRRRPRRSSGFSPKPTA
ncbi:OsmC family protein [Cognatilysobacter segetis]|uniref:OsmC family protein n=1 Tax=Cognatilysobacter segetis TaxID=2492394 RepID=UPI00192E4CE7|nr:OsmC family protein [Lysobacter segetis]